MTITIYWACNEDEWMRAKEPEPVYKKFIKNIKDKNTSIGFCPSIKKYMKNLFYLESIYTYNFEFLENKDGVYSNLHDQNFFDKHVNVRSKDEKLFGFTQNFVFFTEEKSLNMSSGVFPFLEDNNITKKCITVPGTLDIGKWFRLLDFAFYLKKDYNKFEIDEGEIFQYLKFDTSEKIIFKQFYVNKKLKQYLLDVTAAKNFRIIKYRALEEYYLMFKYKKQIIKEIKNNLVNDNG